MIKSKLFVNYGQLILIIVVSIFLNACQNNPQIEKYLSPSKISVEIPQNIPQYPQAKLIKMEATNHYELIKTLWQTNEDQENIKTYYQDQLKQENWQIITPFDNPQETIDNNSAPTNTLIAQKDNLQLKVSMVKNNPTQFTLEYNLKQNNLAQNDTIEGENIPPLPPQNNTPSPSPQPTETPVSLPTPSPDNSPISALDFEDLTTIPESFQIYIQDLNQLGIFTELDGIENNQFKPNEMIKKRDFVRWLVQTNNSIYETENTKKIRLDSPFSELAFRDIPPSDPDFKFIQALAETGIIPSPLTGENNPDLFYPDRPLTREELILWKVPFDLRQALPKADLKVIGETWGFQDKDKINPQVFNALYADFENQKYSNIRRIFGYTTLFQPQKTVTRAEAVASLWYFGTENEGISVKNVLEKKINNQ
jgi:hypothetical protein